MVDEIRRLSAEVLPEVVRLRRVIHAFPELAFEEVETARLVKEALEPLGLEVREGVAQTGIVATLRGTESGPAVLLRADMDALPIQENTGLPFASRVSGKMHACGHDAHTASLLGSAMILARLQSHLAGTIHFVFQPSEERLPGGARVMLDEGLLDTMLDPRPKSVFGQHVQPDLPAGQIGVRSGMYMASADEIYLDIRGEGGHAAAPHRLRSDAVLAAAHVIVALQTVVSRHCPPDVPSILSLGKVRADGATNVLPAEVHIEGTFRAMDESWRFRAHELIRRIVVDTARGLGAEAEVEIIVGYPALYNTPEEAALVRRAAEEYVGAENVHDIDRWFASEDFAWYLQEIPGSFYRLGTGVEGVVAAPGLHTPEFTINEEALRVGSGFMAYMAATYLSSHA